MMNRAEIYRECKSCKNKEIDNYGDVICSLTGGTPDFDDSCPDKDTGYNEPLSSVDSASKTREDQVIDSGKKKKSNVWSIIIVVFVIIRLIMRFVRD